MAFCMYVCTVYECIELASSCLYLKRQVRCIKSLYFYSSLNIYCDYTCILDLFIFIIGLILSCLFSFSDQQPGIGPCPNEQLCCLKGLDIGVPGVTVQPITQGPREPVVPQPFQTGCGIQNPIPYRNAQFPEVRSFYYSSIRFLSHVTSISTVFLIKAVHNLTDIASKHHFHVTLFTL